MKKTLFAAALSSTMLLSAIPAMAAPISPEVAERLDVLGEVFERIRSSYVEDVTETKLLEEAINGMLVSLDPHSSYLNKDDFKAMHEQTKGEFGGLGIEVTMEGGLVKVVSPIEDTPAFEAGVQAGDLIIRIDDEEVQGLTLSEAVERMRGKVDTDITVKIYREETKETFDITITRAVIKIRPVKSRLEEAGIGYVRITSFNRQTMLEVKKHITKVEKENGKELTGLVLDLRNNPGGLLDQAIAVSDAFLDSGEVVSTRGRIKGQSARYNARKGDLMEGKPIVVLINGGSASASEIVAGALQDHKRAVVMGTKSFGKGSVQTIIPLRGKTGMRLTTARYYTPSGRSIQAEGIEPDVTVKPLKVEELDVGGYPKEASLRGHLGNGNGKKDAKKDTKQDKKTKNGENGEKTEDKKPIDYQLQRALGVIKALNIWHPAQS